MSDTVNQTGIGGVQPQSVALKGVGLRRPQKSAAQCPNSLISFLP